MKTKVVLTAVAIGLLFAGPAMAQLSVSVVPANPQRAVIVGDIFEVEIWVDIPPTDPVVGWGVDLTIGDTWIADFTGVLTIGAAWDPPPGGTPDGDGLAGLVPTPPGFGLFGNLLLATVQMEALHEGTTSLTLSDDNPADLTEGFALEPPPVGDFATVTYLPGSITVVPEPRALAALLAMGGLTILRRRR